MGTGILWPWMVRAARFSPVLILNMGHKKQGMRAIWEGWGARFFLEMTHPGGATQD